MSRKPPESLAMQIAFPLPRLDKKGLKRFENRKYRAEVRLGQRPKPQRKKPLDHCLRIGAVRAGGHCIVCGYDVGPREGVMAGPQHITCASKACVSAARHMTITLVDENKEAFHRRRRQWVCTRKDFRNVKK